MSKLETSESSSSDDHYWFAEAYSVRMTNMVHVEALAVFQHLIRDHVRRICLMRAWATL